MNDFLIGYLDGRLLEYLDDEHELRPEIVWRIEVCAGALLDEAISHVDLADDWPDWFVLTPAFVAAYCPEEVTDLQEASVFMAAAETGVDEPLTDEDRTYLETLRFYCDTYPEFRDSTGD